MPVRTGYRCIAQARQHDTWYTFSGYQMLFLFQVADKCFRTGYRYLAYITSSPKGIKLDVFWRVTTFYRVLNTI